MKNKSKLIILLGALTAGAIYGNSIDETYTIPNACYQGHHRSEGRKLLIFDPLPLEQRTKKAKPGYWGDPDKLDLERGNEYDLTMGRPNFSWLFSERILNAQKVNSK